MARDDEAYIHYEECNTSLNEAWCILGRLESSGDPLLSKAAYHMALIAYARPFKESYGVDKRRHRLSLPPGLSASDQKLHQELIRLRDQFLAHSDLSPKDAKVYVGEVSGRPLPLIVSNTDPQLPKPEAVRLLIERLLDYQYNRLSWYQQQFK
jgi:hypothetical protein